jgi:ferredoxin
LTKKKALFIMLLLICSKGGSIMAYVITDECISCGVCADECPVEAIHEGEDKYEIDPELCTECGSCADVCPVEAPKSADA